MNLVPMTRETATQLALQLTERVRSGDLALFEVGDAAGKVGLQLSPGLIDTESGIMWKQFRFRDLERVTHKVLGTAIPMIPTGEMVLRTDTFAFRRSTVEDPAVLEARVRELAKTLGRKGLENYLVDAILRLNRISEEWNQRQQRLESIEDPVSLSPVPEDQPPDGAA